MKRLQPTLYLVVAVLSACRSASGQRYGMCHILPMILIAFRAWPTELSPAGPSRMPSRCPKKMYPYPADKTVTTGIPLQEEFMPVTPELKNRYRGEIDITQDAKLVFVIGGGLGSQRVNQAVGRGGATLVARVKELAGRTCCRSGQRSQMQELSANKRSAAEQGRVRVMGYHP